MSTDAIKWCMLKFMFVAKCRHGRYTMKVWGPIEAQACSCEAELHHAAWKLFCI